jgi:hypothetical protein
MTRLRVPPSAKYERRLFGRLPDRAGGYELPLAGPDRPAPLVLPGEPLPLRGVPASLKELDWCVEKLGMKGPLRDTNPAGKFRDEPEFRPLFRRAAGQPGG